MFGNPFCLVFLSVVFSHALLGPHEHAAVLVASLSGVGHDAGSLGNTNRYASNLQKKSCIFFSQFFYSKGPYHICLFSIYSSSLLSTIKYFMAMTDLFVSWVLVAEDELPLALVHDVAVFASPSWIHLLRANIFRV